MKKKKEHPYRKQGFKSVEGVAGKIVNNIWVKNDDDGFEMIIQFAWGGELRFINEDRIKEKVNLAKLL